MKILLVNPYIYDFTAYDLWLRPLGLLYIAAVLKKYTNCELYWLDTLDRFQAGAFSPGDPALKRSKVNGRGKYHREIVEKPPIYEKPLRPYARYGIPLEVFREKMDRIPAVDMILVTTLMTYWIDGIRFTVDALRERFPTAKIVIGGVLPGLVPVERLRSIIEADYFVSGPGEDKILKIIEAGGGMVYSYPGFAHIDDIPYPAVEFLSSRDFLPLMTSRGCPFCCTYCASGVLNEKFLERAPGKILDEIYYMRNTYGTQHFVVFDDAFLVNKGQRFLKVFRQVSETLKVNFHTPNGVHVGEIDRETAEVLFNSGFKTLRLSFESTTSAILSKSSNKVTIQQMLEAVENLESAGYKRKDIAVYLLFGIPGQRLQQIEQDLRFIKSLGVTPHLSYFSPVPGTVDFIDLQKKGVLAAPVNLYETNKIYFVYNKSNFSPEEIAYIKDQVVDLQDHNK